MLLGGNIINAMGGYNTIKALYTTVFICIFCVAVSVPIGFMDNYWAALVCLWLTLFAGGFMLPTMTGMMLNTVTAENRTTAAAVSNICYNLFGMLPAPFVYGLIAESAGPKPAMIQMMCMSVIAAVLLISVAFPIRARLLEEEVNTEVKKIEEDDK